MTKIKEFLVAFGPGAHLVSCATWHREANGAAYAAYTVDVAVANGAGRFVARAVLQETGDPLWSSYEDEDGWWNGEGGTAADACCRELEQVDWGDTPVEQFESTDGSLLPWEDDYTSGFIGGVSSHRKGRKW